MRNSKEKQGYHAPIPALDEMSGLESLHSFEQVQGRETNLQEKYFFFSVNLEISRTIPFIYDCIREQAPSWQALNAGIEAMIEIHKAYNRHIQQQFDRLQQEQQGGEDARS